MLYLGIGAFKCYELVTPCLRKNFAMRKIPVNFHKNL